jgi:tetratricopeptide (TPR) repeat protein
MQFAEAERHLRAAIARLEFPHTTPKDAEPYYYLGLALRAQGRIDEAYDVFFKATWNGEWKAPAYFELAQIAASRGDLAAARALAERSLAHDAFNPRAQNLLLAVARRATPAEVPHLLTRYPATDPMDVTAIAERARAGDGAAARSLDVALRDHPHAGLEAAVDYLDAGLRDEAATVLDRLVVLAADSRRVDPLVHYFRAHIAEMDGDGAKAAECRRAAREVSLDYAFPFQAQAIPVLERAMAADAGDARAPYLLGTLLFDHQPDRAVALWEAAVRLQPDFTLALRNLALAYAARGTSDGFRSAIDLLERAVATGRSTPVHYFELDQLYEASGTPVDRRLAMMEAHRSEILARDDSTTSYVGLLTFTGRPGAAIDLLRSRVFNIWEGGTRFNPGDAWTDAHLARGRQHQAAGRHRQALADFQHALEFPGNLRAERREGTGGRAAEVAYWTGLAHRAAGKRAAARAAWQAAADAEIPRTRRGGTDASVDGAVQQYYQALALRQLGEPARADQLLRKLLESGRAAVARTPKDLDEFSSFGERRSERSRLSDAHYIVGLGQSGLGRAPEARAAFEAALQANPNHLGARLELDGISK